MEEMSHLEIIQKAKVIGKIGKVSSFIIGNNSLIDKDILLYSNMP
jgi:hypothetical protein